MPKVSKTFILPPEVRKELVEKLVNNGYSDFRGLSIWLERLGYKVSKTALHNFASNLKKNKYSPSERSAVEIFLINVEDAIDVLRNELDIPRRLE